MIEEPTKKALISVSNKDKLYDLSDYLIKEGWTILSTGGTYKKLAEEWNKNIINISVYTGSPECLGGRVKTLHPLIHGGILARTDDEHDKIEMVAYNIDPISMVVVNLYPFEQVVSQGKPFEECIENIDIGGVALIRAAAKNYKYVVPVCDVNDYSKIIDLYKGLGEIPLGVRFSLATKAFNLTTAYDKAIVQFMEEETMRSMW